MALLIPQKIVLAGIVPVYNEAAAGEGDADEFLNTGLIVIHIKNANATLARTVTIDTYTKCNYGLDTEHDVAVEIAGQAEKVIGPFPKSRFNDAEGKVQILYSDAAADLTIAVVDLP